MICHSPSSSIDFAMSSLLAFISKVQLPMFIGHKPQKSFILLGDLKKTIGEYKNLLNRHFSLFSAAAQQGKQAKEAPVLMITYAYEFGRDVLDLAESMFQDGKDSVLACAVCRPYYEIAFRLL